jgi:Eukaryotic-type carbonic anhydrase
MLETTTLENDKDSDSWNADGKDVNEEELVDQGWREAVLKEPISVDAHGDLPLRHDDENEKDVDKANADKDDELERRDLQLFLQRTRRPTRSPTRSPAPSITPAPSSTPTMALQILNFPYFNRLWQPYDWVNACKTEYYFRYLGSLVEPPCFVGVHWRIMRSPIKISPRQLRILSTLLAFRQDPITCKTMSSVGKPRKDGSSFVDVNRPIQRLQGQHDLVFCECVDWNSSIIEDKAYCTLTMEQRGVLPSPTR